MSSNNKHVKKVTYSQECSNYDKWIRGAYGEPEKLIHNSNQECFGCELERMRELVIALLKRKNIKGSEMINKSTCLEIKNLRSITLGWILREIRIDLGLSLEEVAKDIGCHKYYLKMIEDGKEKSRGLFFHIKLFDFYGIDGVVSYVWNEID